MKNRGRLIMNCPVCGEGMVLRRHFMDILIILGADAQESEILREQHGDAMKMNHMI